MYRVALVGALCLAVAACSVNSSSLTSGFADSPSVTASLPPSSSASSPSSRRAAPSGALGGEPDTKRGSGGSTDKGTVVAKLDDKAPQGSFETAPTGSLAGRDYSGTTLDPEKAREIINAYRKKHGLKPLKLNAELTAAAKEHSRDLSKWDRISHFGSDGSNPWDRVKRTGYKPSLAAENVGTGQTTFDEVMKGWEKSPGHNKNLLLADAEHMGIALVQDPRTEFKSFWTLVLGSAK